MSPSRCESCGAEFDCGAGTGSCWCNDASLDDAARAALAQRFDRCLCPACLEVLSRRPDPGRASAAAAPRPSAGAPGR